MSDLHWDDEVTVTMTRKDWSVVTEKLGMQIESSRNFYRERKQDPPEQAQDQWAITNALIETIGKRLLGMT